MPLLEMVTRCRDCTHCCSGPQERLGKVSHLCERAQRVPHALHSTGMLSGLCANTESP